MSDESASTSFAQVQSAEQWFFGLVGAGLFVLVLGWIVVQVSVHHRRG